MTKKYLFLTVFIILCCLGTNGSTAVKIENVFVSVYIWRGFDITNDSPAFQPSLTLKEEKTGIGFCVWNSTGLDRKRTKKVDEWDFILSYSKVVSNIGELSSGYIHYNFPNGNLPNVTHEFVLGFSLNTLFSPAIKLYYDVKIGTGIYVIGSVSQKILNLPLFAGAAIGYNRKMYIMDSGISDVTFSLSGNVPLNCKYIFFSPSVNYTIIPRYMQGNYGLSKHNKFWGTIGFGILF